MKRIAFIMSALALMVFASCDNKGDGPNLDDVVEDGFFVTGAATGTTEISAKLMMTSGVNEKLMNDDKLSWSESRREGMYEKYIKWGLIDQAEARGGWHPYLRAGLTYDSRNMRTCPTKGIYADAFFTYTAAFNAKYGQQADAGYNHLQFNFNFRHYVPVYQDRVIFAYRLGVQNNIAGKSPFYMNSYLNTIFIQRVMYEGLGGANSLRGIMRNRILANGFAYANVELRCKVAKFDIGRQHFYIGLAPFFDLGVITQPYELDEEALNRAYAADTDPLKLPLSSYFATVKNCWSETGTTTEDIDLTKTYFPHMAAGLGLKIAMNENFVLSVDWAMALNKQDNAKWANFYIKMGYLF